MYWYIYALISAFSWGLVTIFSRLASERADASLIALIQSCCVSIILFSSALLSQRFSMDMLHKIHAKDWSYLLLAAASCSLAWLFYFEAFQSGPVSKVVSIDRLSFVFIILLSAAVFGETPNWSMISGACLMTVGVILVAMA